MQKKSDHYMVTFISNYYFLKQMVIMLEKKNGSCIVRINNWPILV